MSIQIYLSNISSNQINFSALFLHRCPQKTKSHLFKVVFEWDNMIWKDIWKINLNWLSSAWINIRAYFTNFHPLKPIKMQNLKLICFDPTHSGSFIGLHLDQDWFTRPIFSVHMTQSKPVNKSLGFVSYLISNGIPCF